MLEVFLGKALQSLNTLTGCTKSFVSRISLAHSGFVLPRGKANAHHDIGFVDLAKSVFQVRDINRDGTMAVRHSFRGAELLNVFGMLPPCFVGIQACAAAHYWAREIGRFGHTVTVDAPRRLQTLCEEEQKRYGRCRGHLRSRDETEHALCGGQDSSAKVYPI